MMPLRLGIVQLLISPQHILAGCSSTNGCLYMHTPGGQFADGCLNDLQRTKQVARIPPTGGISSISLTWEDLSTGPTDEHTHMYTPIQWWERLGRRLP